MYVYPSHSILSKLIHRLYTYALPQYYPQDFIK